ncbi:TPA: hypothetical protein I8612_002734 [Citrobacter koseri]|nr:hypothetical protein [Citrobacter koseri]
MASSTPDGAENGGIQLHLAITEATHNSMQVEPFYQSREWRENNSMWIQLYCHLNDARYRKEWLVDHKQILASIIKKDARAAKLVMSIWRTSNSGCWSSPTFMISESPLV